MVHSNPSKKLLSKFYDDYKQSDENILLLDFIKSKAHIFKSCRFDVEKLHIVNAILRKFIKYSVEGKFVSFRKEVDKSGFDEAPPEEVERQILALMEKMNLDGTSIYDISLFDEPFYLPDTVLYEMENNICSDENGNEIEVEIRRMFSEEIEHKEEIKTNQSNSDLMELDESIQINTENEHEDEIVTNRSNSELSEFNESIQIDTENEHEDEIVSNQSSSDVMELNESIQIDTVDPIEIRSNPDVNNSASTEDKLKEEDVQLHNDSAILIQSHWRRYVATSNTAGSLEAVGEKKTMEPFQSQVSKSISSEFVTHAGPIISDVEDKIVSIESDYTRNRNIINQKICEGWAIISVPPYSCAVCKTALLILNDRMSDQRKKEGSEPTELNEGELFQESPRIMVEISGEVVANVPYCVDCNAYVVSCDNEYEIAIMSQYRGKIYSNVTKNIAMDTYFTENVEGKEATNKDTSTSTGSVETQRQSTKATSLAKKMQAEKKTFARVLGRQNLLEKLQKSRESEMLLFEKAMEEKKVEKKVAQAIFELEVKKKQAEEAKAKEADEKKRKEMAQKMKILRERYAQLSFEKNMREERTLLQKNPQELYDKITNEKTRLQTEKYREEKSKGPIIMTEGKKQDGKKLAGTEFPEIHLPSWDGISPASTRKTAADVLSFLKQKNPEKQKLPKTGGKVEQKVIKNQNQAKKMEEERLQKDLEWRQMEIARMKAKKQDLLETAGKKDQEGLRSLEINVVNNQDQALNKKMEKERLQRDLEWRQIEISKLKAKISMRENK
mmetsp:Transcript_4411/g.6525  ORF Transcript_4411/g.6525 Transcript_4411/m.6525 type:complete len:785 (+) Transcript_4411:153-2507(+)